MTDEEFINLELKNISEEELVPGFISMWVDIKDCRYGFRIVLRDDGYRVRSLNHFDQEKPCQLCSNKRGICEALEPYKEELFHRLVHSKELRLNWITTRHFKWD